MAYEIPSDWAAVPQSQRDWWAARIQPSEGGAAGYAAHIASRPGGGTPWQKKAASFQQWQEDQAARPQRVDTPTVGYVPQDDGTYVLPAFGDESLAIQPGDSRLEAAPAPEAPAPEAPAEEAPAPLAPSGGRGRPSKRERVARAMAAQEAERAQQKAMTDAKNAQDIQAAGQMALSKDPTGTARFSAPLGGSGFNLGGSYDVDTGNVGFNVGRSFGGSAPAYQPSGRDRDARQQMDALSAVEAQRAALGLMDGGPVPVPGYAWGEVGTGIAENVLGKEAGGQLAGAVGGAGLEAVTGAADPTGGLVDIGTKALSGEGIGGADVAKLAGTAFGGPLGGIVAGGVASALGFADGSDGAYIKADGPLKASASRRLDRSKGVKYPKQPSAWDYIKQRIGG